MNTNRIAEMVETAAADPADWMATIQNLGIEYGMKILGALSILIIGIWVAKQIKKRPPSAFNLVALVLARSFFSKTIGHFLCSLMETLSLAQKLRL